ncbi:MAG: hypothetical protein HOQ32_11800 [Lysobacter sp.]|nr:hypothetical protein [Lysobacter sp.]
MFKVSAVLACSLLLGACAQPALAPVASSGPFVGVDLSQLPERDRAIIREASEDFQAVVRGDKPVHAKFDEQAALPSDGGTTFYKGNGYDLTILVSMSGFGQFRGTAYGPILTFDSKFAPGNTNEISDVRVYSNEKLRELLR